MSHLAISQTPFIIETILIKALEACNATFTQSTNKITINSRVDRLGNQYFEKRNNKWVFCSYSDEIYYQIKNDGRKQSLAPEFIQEVNTHYTRIQKEIEDEEIKRQKETYVRDQKEKIIAKATAQGYSVREKIIDKKVQLVLVRQC